MTAAPGWLVEGKGKGKLTRRVRQACRSLHTEMYRSLSAFAVQKLAIASSIHVTYFGRKP